MKRIENGVIAYEFEQTTIGSDGAVHCRMQRVVAGRRIGDVVFYLDPGAAREALESPSLNLFEALAGALIAGEGELAGGVYKAD